jgi:signal transduction histidine kinase
MSSQLIDYKGEEMIVSSIFDLTERNAVAEEMARQRQALYQSEKLSALGSLLASVAHELNNPLSIVVAQSMLLEELASDPDISKRATKISTAADRCARIVKTFLAMARQEPAEYRAIKLNEVVKSALDVTGHALRSSGIEVSSRLASDLPSIQGDADQLTQVVTNLILNAQQAMEGMEGDGWLKITTSHRPRTGELVVKIKDNGPGIGTDVRSRIFEPFFTTKKMEDRRPRDRRLPGPLSQFSWSTTRPTCWMFSPIFCAATVMTWILQTPATPRWNGCAIATSLSSSAISVCRASTARDSTRSSDRNCLRLSRS